MQQRVAEDKRDKIHFAIAAQAAQVRTNIKANTFYGNQNVNELLKKNRMCKQCCVVHKYFFLRDAKLWEEIKLIF